MAVITGNDLANALNGTGGADQIDAKGGNDVVFANGGDDVINGGSGNDELYGMGGNDFITGGSGADRIDGGADIDTADYSGSAGGVVVNLADGVGLLNDAAGDRLFSIENVDGSNFGDWLVGNNVANLFHANGGADTVHAAGGADTVFGQGGNDTLFGGDGDDVLDGGAGADRLDGGAGVDTASYASSATGVLVDLTSGQRTNDAQGDVFVGIERFLGSSKADSFRGNGAANTFVGDGGNDVLFGEGGRDELDGGAGADIIQGGSGADYLSGGAGADLFLFTGLGDSGLAASERDIIWDFSRSQGDRISLADIDAKTGTLVNDAFEFIDTQAFSAAGQIRYFHSGGSTIVELNVVGTSGAEMRIALAGAVDLIAGDFVL